MVAASIAAAILTASLFPAAVAVTASVSNVIAADTAAAPPTLDTAGFAATVPTASSAAVGVVSVAVAVAFAAATAALASAAAFAHPFVAVAAPN